MKHIWRVTTDDYQTCQDSKATVPSRTIPDFRIMKKISRMTRQKMVIIEEIKNCKIHPTADELHKRLRKKLPYISLATVYRNLKIMSETGQISKLKTKGKSKLFDWDSSPHDHIYCLQCQRVDNINITDIIGITMPYDINCGYKISGHKFEFSGICPECLIDSKTNNKGDNKKMACKSKCGTKGLSDNQREVLEALQNAPDDICGSKDIAAATSLEAKQVSCQITALKKKGFVESPVRCKYSITENGKEALAKDA